MVLIGFINDLSFQIQRSQTSHKPDFFPLLNRCLDCNKLKILFANLFVSILQVLFSLLRSSTYPTRLSPWYLVLPRHPPLYPPRWLSACEPNHDSIIDTPHILPASFGRKPPLLFRFWSPTNNLRTKNLLQSSFCKLKFNFHKRRISCSLLKFD